MRRKWVAAGSPLTAVERTVLEALPEPADAGETARQIVDRTGVSPFPLVHGLVLLGLAERRGRSFWARTRAGMLWLRAHP